MARRLTTIPLSEIKRFQVVSIHTKRSFKSGRRLIGFQRPLVRSYDGIPVFLFSFFFFVFLVGGCGRGDFLF
ncbi:hypothetical protein BDW02DRAFT_106847 [Decorospora gaudefroyi]|uniref:Uncharacterized protein n=1 Tax=Decorospora gaudefroyi TaxID=184978 RepID=A0A6A5KVG6_9PLEO|nr:hypothetical protein BDW02DRAFT_106847 [Decorospora gaudefroyi]